MGTGSRMRIVYNKNEMNKKLSPNEMVRYARHLNIPDLGITGQLKLKNSSVLIAGCGGLGSASSLYLAAAGIGRIGLVDSDVVELSNLQRQIIHATDDIGLPKVQSASSRLSALNPEIMISMRHERILQENVEDLILGYDIVVDATDNFETVERSQCSVGETICLWSNFPIFRSNERL